MEVHCTVSVSSCHLLVLVWMVCVFTISESPQPPPRTHRNRLHSLPNAVNSECLCMAFIWTCWHHLLPLCHVWFCAALLVVLVYYCRSHHNARMKEQTSVIQTQRTYYYYSDVPLANIGCWCLINAHGHLLMNRLKNNGDVNSESLNRWG